jgi:hypothetical protein
MLGSPVYHAVQKLSLTIATKQMRAICLIHEVLMSPLATSAFLFLAKRSQISSISWASRQTGWIVEFPRSHRSQVFKFRQSVIARIRFTVAVDIARADGADQSSRLSRRQNRRPMWVKRISKPRFWFHHSH